MKEPVFTVGQRVIASGSYGWTLTEGKEYAVTAYAPEYVTPHFTFPPYVSVIGDNGKTVTGHTYRFRDAT